ncbi:hypothetical protein BKI52_36430 [marine bacterium AO1-C]|nr:hypothetical protein BKI52_36430 [marine bacterium AO1-C]
MDSLQNQTSQDFELIFVDYGSQQNYQQDIESLVKKYAFAQYIYTDTRGWFWNRSKALNLGIHQATTDKIITLDIDLILESDFLTKVTNHFSPNHYLRFSYYYLPQNVNNLSKLFLDSYPPERHLDKTSSTTNFGVLAFTKTAFFKAGGYNGYYKVWGLEDIDFVKRLEASGITSQGFIEGLRIYHQWHPKSQPQLPKGWYEEMNQYFQKQQGNKKQKITLKPSKPININNRPALLSKINDSAEDHIAYVRFDFPKELSFVKFIYLFNQLKPGQQIRVQQKFQLIDHYQETRWGRLIHKINKLLAKLRISYRWIDLGKFNTGLISKKEITDFLFHFLITWQNQILDYYFDYQTSNDEVFLIIIKK